MIIEPGSCDIIKLDVGITTTIETKFSCKYVIETNSGTIIKIMATPSTPLTITPSTDIKQINLILDDDTIRPLHLVEQAK
jgi:hypothetical protein